MQSAASNNILPCKQVGDDLKKFPELIIAEISMEPITPANMSTNYGATVGLYGGEVGWITDVWVTFTGFLVGRDCCLTWVGRIFTRAVFVGTGVAVSVGVGVRVMVGVSVGWRMTNGKLRLGDVAVRVGSTTSCKAVAVFVYTTNVVGSFGCAKITVMGSKPEKNAKYRGTPIKIIATKNKRTYLPLRTGLTA